MPAVSRFADATHRAQIQRDIERTAYSPCTWRTQPLHVVPPDHYSRDDPRTRSTLDWIFLISSLNFSFWSERPAGERFGVEWRRGWADDARVVHTGYWSLVAALDRGTARFHSHSPRQNFDLPISARGRTTRDRSAGLFDPFGRRGRRGIRPGGGVH